MSSVSGGLSNMSMWVQFLDVHGRTRVVPRAQCRPVIGDQRAVCLESSDGLSEYIFTRDTYEEIMR